MRIWPGGRSLRVAIWSLRRLPKQGRRNAVASRFVATAATLWVERSARDLRLSEKRRRRTSLPRDHRRRSSTGYSGGNEATSFDGFCGGGKAAFMARDSQRIDDSRVRFLR